MKKVIYVMICMLWLTCANETKNKSESVEYRMEAISAEEDDISMDLKPINYEQLAEHKLMEYFDLLRLKQEHPEFEKDIISQLQGFSNDSESIDSYEKIDSIINIRQLGKLIKESDSIQKMRLYFDIVSGITTTSDSVMAIITIKFITVEGRKIPSTKVMFKNIKE